MQYDKMLERALRGVVREALGECATHGLEGEHHFYIVFRTDVAGVEITPRLRARYPREMTIVIQHKFWDLEVDEAGFTVTLTFDQTPERLVVPWQAITAFADPSVEFGLQFKTAEAAAAAAADEAESAAEALPKGDAEVVSLDSFRRK